ncbi:MULTISPECIES: rRNA maturation RNase YbeY [Cohnella]|uniref:rRNA maturation RNase YbeY n=1 Tax=Cohnella TaxID=329857 RepID=UPI0009B99E41|nr:MULTISPECIES: rRNA maturation RNase YbeY [Cohnella]MBN2983313.1 rRNA maturation RNase YbeY [Cohnella algarum]
MALTLEWVDEREEGAVFDDKWRELLDRLMKIAAETEGVEDGVVTLTLTDEEGIRELNREYRGLDKPTDVLSFPMRETAEPAIRYDDDYETVEIDGEEEPAGSEAPDDYDPFAELLGDIVISVPRMYAQAEEYGHSPERELGFLFVHGFLHLLGYDHGDEAEEKEMFAKQEAALAKAGLTR